MRVHSEEVICYGVVGLLVFLLVSWIASSILYQKDPAFKERVDMAKQQRMERSCTMGNNAVIEEEDGATQEEDDTGRRNSGLRYGPSFNSKGEYGIGFNFNGYRF